MPKVGKMKFPYTKKGMEEASAYAKNTGKAMEMEGGGIIPKYRGGGRVPGIRGVSRPIRRIPIIGGTPMAGALGTTVGGRNPRFKKGGKVK